MIIRRCYTRDSRVIHVDGDGPRLRRIGLEVTQAGGLTEKGRSLFLALALEPLS